MHGSHAGVPEPVLWLALGDQQLHLFQRDDVAAPRAHHLAIDVDDFDASTAGRMNAGAERGYVGSRRSVPPGRLGADVHAGSGGEPRRGRLART